MIGIWALGAYLAVILLWTTVIKRSVGEAMILGFLVVLNLRGVKESVNFLAPIFVAFVVMHVFVIGYTFFADFSGLPRTMAAFEACMQLDAFQRAQPSRCPDAEA